MLYLIYNQGGRGDCMERDISKRSLKELRARDELTQEDVANALKVSVQTYNAWENNPSMIKLGNALAICELFNIKLNEIKL